MPPKPRPPAVESSPAANPLRSIPAQKVPPAPVMISEVMSLRESKSSRIAAMLRATASLTALRASGRLIVMMPMPSATSTVTASATACLPIARGNDWPPASMAAAVEFVPTWAGT